MLFWSSILDVVSCNEEITKEQNHWYNNNAPKPMYLICVHAYVSTEDR